MIEIYQEYGGIPIHFIRFNPDKYKTIGKQETLKTRLTKLCAVIKQIKRSKDFFIRHPHLSVRYMYYDDYNNVQEVIDIDYGL